jgi:transposase
MAIPVTEEMIARQTPEAQGMIRSLLEIIRRQQVTINSLLARVDELNARIQVLEAALDQKNKTPLNSSVPPSTEHPHAKSLGPRPPTKRPRGGQAGHPKRQRTLLDPEDCHEVVPLKPMSCRSCGKALGGIDPDPLRHQVREIPQPQPVVIESQRHRLT